MSVEALVGVFADSAGFHAVCSAAGGRVARWGVKSHAAVVFELLFAEEHVADRDTDTAVEVVANSGGAGRTVLAHPGLDTYSVLDDCSALPWRCIKSRLKVPQAERIQSANYR